MTPWSMALAAHNAFVKAAFLLLLGFLTSITVLQGKNEWPRRCTISDVLYLVLLAVPLHSFAWGKASLATARGLAIQVAAQKIIVHASIVNLGYQALGIRGGALEARGESQVG
jgi:hypothetical protein